MRSQEDDLHLQSNPLNPYAMQDEIYEDPRLQADAEREEYEKEGDAATPQTRYARERRMKEKDEWYSILDEKE